MTALRILLVTVIAVVGVYTAIVIAEYGINLFPYFFGDMAAMTWAGQFNMDFLCFLVFSGTWLAWRHQFSPAGCAIGVGGFFLGAPYLSAYLLIQLGRTQGDVAALLLGPERAAALRGAAA